MANDITITADGSAALSTFAFGAKFEEIMQRFILNAEVMPSSANTYKTALRQFFTWLISKGITHPEKRDILAYKEELVARLKPTTAQNYIVAVKRFFKWAHEEDESYADIAKNVSVAKGNLKVSRGHKKDYLTSSQVKELLGNLDRADTLGQRDYAILALMITSGLRTIEVIRADIGDMRTLGDSTVLYVQGKGRTEKADFVKVQPQVEKAIRDYLKTRTDKAEDAPLFTSESRNSKGNRLSTRTIRGLVKAHMREAGYDSDKLTAHSLRHTAVTLAFRAGKDITEVQQFARHANIATTLIYLHEQKAEQNACGAAIAKAIF